MTSPDDALKTRLIARLTHTESPLRTELTTSLVDFTLDQPLKRFIDTTEILSILTDALTVEHLADPVRRVGDGFARYIEHSQGAGERVGDLIPESARPALEALVMKTRGPKFAWAAGAVEPALLRRLYAPVIQHVLLSFVQKLPVPGFGGGSGGDGAGSKRPAGIASVLGRKVQERAGQLMDASRSVMGGLGAEMERRLQASTREFSESAAGLVRDGLRERLQSDEGRELSERVRRQALEHVLRTPVHAILTDLDRIPMREIFDLAPALIAHNVGRQFVREVIERELTLVLEIEGKQTLGSLLEQYGVLEPGRRLATRRADGIAQEFFASPAFSDWLDRALDAGD